MTAIRIPRELSGALRNYQRDAVQAMTRYTERFDPRRPRAALVHMPTGSGKTGVIASLARCTVRSGPVVVIAPRVGLREQLARDVGQRFFRHAGVDATSLPRRVMELNKGSSHPGDLDDLVIVTTVQMLTSIYKSRRRLSQDLREGAVLVLFDEGHYEPAAVWSQVVRSMNCPRIIFTATAFRDDFKTFDVDPDYVYRYSFDHARRERYVRDVRLHPYAPVRSPAHFAEQVLQAYDRLFDAPDEADTDRPRVIIRCDQPEEIRQLSSVLSNQGRSVVGIHETFDENPRPNEYRKVPDPDKVNATFWVHQFKLLEGIDDARFQMLALYSELRGMRAFVQQVGRVIRNPNRTRDAIAHVLDHSRRGRQTSLWREFLEYDRQLEQGDPKALELNQQSLVETLQKAVPGLLYVNGRLRTPLALRELTLGSLQMPLSANVFEKPAKFSLGKVQKLMVRRCEEDDLVFHAPVPDSKTAVVFYIQIGTSPFLERGFFAEPKLGVSLVHQGTKYLFVFDSGPALAASVIGSPPVQAERLRKLFVQTSDAKLTHVSMNNSNIGADQVRARATTAVSVDQLAPSFDEHGYVLSTATGYSRGCRGTDGDEVDRVRRYIGIGSGRVSDFGGGFMPFDDWVQWTKGLERILDGGGRTLEVFRRWASDAPWPTDATPRNVLLDVSDVLDRYFTTGDGMLAAGAPMELSELCADVRHGKFTISANGKQCEVRIQPDPSRLRYELSSPELDQRYFSNDADNREGLTRYLNRTQSMRVIPASPGFFYTLGQFCRPLIHFGPQYDDAKMGVLRSLVSASTLRDITSEKGQRCRPNGTGWEAGCLFDLIDQLGRGTELQMHFEGTEVLVCDDLGNESADFILLQRPTRSHGRRVIFIHAKASRVGSTCSASALQDVCGQAQKNLREVSLFADPWPSKTPKWRRRWESPPHTEGFVTRRIRKNSLRSDPEESIRRAVKDPNADREVWLMLGNLLSAASLTRALRQAPPPGYANQAAYLLFSTVTNVAAAGARLKVFCA